MTHQDIARLRLHNQQLAATRFHAPTEVVAWLGMVQAQDYPGAKWALGLRLPGATDADIERGQAERAIVRTWPARGTLHFVAPEDVRWMLRLLAPRIVARAAGRFRQLELTDAVFARGFELLAGALHGGRQLTRKDVFAVLEGAGIQTAGQRGIHILWRAAQEELICFGPMAGKQPTFVLLDEWVAPDRAWDPDEALAEVTRRYFRSHGPATVQDFVWWSGLPVGEARRGLGLVAPALELIVVAGTTYWLFADQPASTANLGDTHLLPSFDEYIVGYKDRGAALDPVHAARIMPGGGMLSRTLVADGRVIGTWQRELKKDTVVVTARTFESPSTAEERAIERAAERYARFHGLGLSLTLIEMNESADGHEAPSRSSR
jgi:hypothetical protein